MMKSAASRWIYAVSFVLAGAGFLVPYWPLALLGIMLSALSGRWIFGLFIAVLLDAAWGVLPLFGFLYFPFTLAALVAALARYWGARSFFDRSHPDTL